VSIMNKFGEWISPNDPQLVRTTLARLGEQDRWNDVFSTKLIELLDKHDNLRSEYRQMLSKATSDLEAAKSDGTKAKELLDSAIIRYNDAEKRFLEAAQNSFQAKDLLSSAVSRHNEAEKHLLEVAENLKMSNQRLQSAERLLKNETRKTKQVAAATVAVLIVVGVWFASLGHQQPVSFPILATLLTAAVAIAVIRKIE
jgi:hypothetical protein